MLRSTRPSQSTRPSALKHQISHEHVAHGCRAAAFDQASAVVTPHQSRTCGYCSAVPLHTIRPSAVGTPHLAQHADVVLRGRRSHPGHRRVEHRISHEHVAYVLRGLYTRPGIGGGNAASVTSMRIVFRCASALNQAIGGWSPLQSLRWMLFARPLHLTMPSAV